MLDYLKIDLIQLAALVFGVSEVLLARANKVWLYPAGITAILLSIYSLLKVQLYAECMLHLYYLVMSIYGWRYWTASNGHNAVVISVATKKEWYITGGIVFGAWLTLYWFLTMFTPSDVPAWDAWVSATGWAGMWLLARRKVENWVLLNVSNAFAIPLLMYKELYAFAALTAFLFAVACKGYFDWARIARETSLKSSDEHKN